MTSHNCMALSLVAVALVRASVSSLPPRTLVEPCVPGEVSIGDKQTTVLVVKTYSRASSDFQQYPEKLLSTRHHRLRNDSELFGVAANVSARFSGGNVCLSAVRLRVTDEGGVNERKESTCERVCLNTTHQDVKLILNSTSGGRAWPGTLCCVWATQHYLVLSLQRPSYRCVTCQGSSCRRADLPTKQCAPGDRCFSLTLRQRSPPYKASPLYSGCTSDVMFAGYSCWNGCRESVRTPGSTSPSRVCLQCCVGHSCNKHFNTTTVNVNPSAAPGRKRKSGKRSEENAADEVCKDYRANGRAGGPLTTCVPLLAVLVGSGLLIGGWVNPGLYLA